MQRWERQDAQPTNQSYIWWYPNRTPLIGLIAAFLNAKGTRSVAILHAILQWNQVLQLSCWVSSISYNNKNKTILEPFRFVNIKNAFMIYSVFTFIFFALEYLNCDRPNGQMSLFKQSVHLGLTGRHVCWPKPTSKWLISVQYSLKTKMGIVIWIWLWAAGYFNNFHLTGYLHF